MSPIDGSDAVLPSSTVLDAAPDAMLVVDHEGIIRRANAQAERIFGRTAGELIGQPVEVLIPEEQRTRHVAHRESYRATARVRPMGAGLSLTGVRPDGSIIPVEVSLSPLDMGGNQWAIAAVRDVTDQRALHAQSEFINYLMDSIEDGVVIFDPDALTLTHANSGARHQFGLADQRTPDERLDPLRLAPPGMELPAFRRFLAPLLLGELTSVTYTTTVVRDGVPDLPVEVVLQYPESAYPEFDRQLVAVVRDITDRVASQALRDRHEAWLEGLATVRLGMLRGLDTETSLAQVCTWARRIARGTVAAIARYDAMTDELVVDTAIGTDQAAGLRVPVADSLIGTAFHTAGATTHDAPFEVELAGERVTVGAACVAPIVGDDRNHGVILVARAGVDAEPFSFDDTDALVAFAHEAAVALELAEAREATTRFHLLEERERIGRDLHDMVIQRLFATGMRLQAMAPIIANSEIEQRIGEAIDELDATIVDIRNTIFRLHEPVVRGLEARIRELVASRVPALGFTPNLDVDTKIERANTRAGEQLLATLTEALANVVRHAEATSCDIEIGVVDEHLVLHLRDDGVGMPDNPRKGNGLDNMMWRAATLGGSCQIARTPDGPGTLLEWRVPLTVPA